MTGDVRAKSKTYLPPPSSSGGPYHVLDERWEHDHCEMCWAKLMDPQFSTKHAQFIREHPDVLTIGLVTEEQERRPERRVCEPCFEDSATEFGWVGSAC